MAQEIIGLDLGHFSLRAVRLSRGLTGVDWAGAAERRHAQVLPPLWDLGALGEAVGALWTDNRLPRGRVVAGVPTHLTSVRMLTLPFADPRRVEQVVPYEVEALLPRPLEEVVIDYQIVQTRARETDVLVFALPKGTLVGLLDVLRESGLDPIAVEPQATALYSLAATLRPAAGAVALVDIGAQTTQFTVLRDGRLAYARALLSGGAALTRAITAKLGLPEADAEEAKCLAGLNDLAVARYREVGLSETVRAALAPWTGEVVAALHLYATDGAAPIEAIQLAGGGARLNGLDRYLAEATGLPVALLDRPALLPSSEPWDPALATALGLAFKDGTRRTGSTINFRRREFAHAGETTRTQTRARYVWIGLAAILALAGADMYVKYSFKQARYQDAKAELRAEFQRAFPEIKTVVDELQQARSAIAELDKTTALLGLGEPTPMQVLAEVTARIPRAVGIEVQDLAIESKRVRLEAETDSFESVDRVKAALEASPRFVDVSVSDAKATANQNTIRFRLAFDLEAADAAGGT